METRVADLEKVVKDTKVIRDCISGWAYGAGVLVLLVLLLLLLLLLQAQLTIKDNKLQEVQNDYAQFRVKSNQSEVLLITSVRVLAFVSI